MQDVLFEGRTETKLVYRDSHSLIWKIGQVAIAALLTLISLGIALCFRNGMIWKETSALFKDRIVHQNVAVQPAAQVIIPSSSKPLDIAGTVPTPNGNVVDPLPVCVPPPVPVVIPVASLSPADLALKKEGILKENPEYGKAVQAWEKAGVSSADQVARLEELKQYAFGTDKWVKYFGDIVGAVPPLPEDSAEICNSNDHSKPGKKVKDTHVLVLVPEAIMVNGKRFDITLKSLGELVKTPKGGGHKTQYRVFYAARLENTPVAKSHWALMNKEIIPGSKKQTFAKQVDMVKEYSQHAKVQYSVPNTIDAVACCFMNFVNSGTRLFESWRPESMTFTRCQELFNEKSPLPFAVGGFDLSGLNLYPDRTVSGSFGVVAARKF